MHLADGHAAVGVIFMAVSKTAAVERVAERRWDEAGLVLVAEAAEEVVFLGEGLIDANVEIVAVFAFLGVGQVVAASQVDVRRRIQRRQAGRQRIDDRNFIGGNRAAVDREAAESGGIIRADRNLLGQASVEEFSAIGGIPVAIPRDGAIRKAGYGIKCRYRGVG